MPLYEYQCKDCGHEFEELVSMSEADRVACEKCGGRRTQRLMSTFCDTGSGESDAPPACLSGG